MKLGQQFNTRFRTQIKSTLGCFDRVLFSGYLSFYSNSYVNAWVGSKLKLRIKDFIPQMKIRSDRLVESAKQLASRSGAPFHYLQGRCRKDDFVEEIASQRGHPQGLLAVLCVQESCRTVKLKYQADRPQLKYEYRPQRVLYFYLEDPHLGRMFVRLQTWFPWKIQVYVNGHDWLACQLRRKQMTFVQQDNAFLQIDDPRRAQRIADRFAGLNWPQILGTLASRFNTLLSDPWLQDQTYNWVLDQVEYSTDVLFTDQALLADLYPRLLDHAVTTFRAQDIMTFLGRRLDPRFQGEIQTHCRKDRQPGARIKHRVEDNWLKMYDKFGRMIRVETVLNSPRGFHVYRPVDQGTHTTMKWKPLRKNVIHFPRYQEILQASNQRYLDALSTVQDTSSACYQQAAELTRPKRHAGRSYAGFNVADKADIDLFAAVLAGEHHLRGFQVKDLLAHLHANTSRIGRRRHAQTLSRQIKRLHVRGLVAKIPRSHRWKVTPKGATLFARVITLYHRGLANAA